MTLDQLDAECKRRSNPGEMGIAYRSTWTGKIVATWRVVLADGNTGSAFGEGETCEEALKAAEESVKIMPSAVMLEKVASDLI